MNLPNPETLETDPRFPSGAWTGYFVQAGKHSMEMNLTFRRGVLTGEGRDRVGRFSVKGKYQVEDGKCYWTKRYLGQHDVFYQGFNEGKGIWGVWEIPTVTLPGYSRGGFHIWPEGMPDPTGEHLHEQADLPVTVE